MWNLFNKPKGRPREEKSCPGCGTGDLHKFGKNRSRRDGLQTYCRSCIKAQRAWKPIRQKRDYETALVEAFIKKHSQE